jgi:hypothetical protein
MVYLRYGVSGVESNSQTVCILTNHDMDSADTVDRVSCCMSRFRTTRATQVYPEDQDNYNLVERDIKALQRHGRNLPADSQVIPRRNDNPNAVRVMTTAPLTDWSKGWPRTMELYSRRTAQAPVPAPSTTSSQLQLL